MSSLTNKIKNAIANHPKLVTFGIVMGITFVIATVIQMEHSNNIWQLWLHAPNTSFID